MRPIDADKLVDMLYDNEFAVLCPLDEVSGVVDACPTVDAVVVTQCKDCKHFKNYGKTSLLMDGENIKAGWCHRRARYDEEYRMPPDGFCSYGEKKDGGAGRDT